jgi:hypothetical protein
MISLDFSELDASLIISVRNKDRSVIASSVPSLSRLARRRRECLTLAMPETSCNTAASIAASCVPVSLSQHRETREGSGSKAAYTRA